MAKAPLKSIHPLDMADALTAQNEAVASLLATCGAVIALGGMSETAKADMRANTGPMHPAP